MQAVGINCLYLVNERVLTILWTAELGLNIQL